MSPIPPISPKQAATLLVAVQATDAVACAIPLELVDPSPAPTSPSRP